jgi:hypothetical protein
VIDRGVTITESPAPVPANVEAVTSRHVTTITLLGPDITGTRVIEGPWIRVGEPEPDANALHRQAQGIVRDIGREWGHSVIDFEVDVERQQRTVSFTKHEALQRDGYLEVNEPETWTSEPDPDAA